jgi:hypothetical protein
MPRRQAGRNAGYQVGEGLQEDAMAGLWSRTVIRLAAWTAVAIVGGAAVYGVAAAATAPTGATATTVGTTPAALDSAVREATAGPAQARRGSAGHPRLRRFLAGRALHGEFVVETKDGGVRTVVAQKGEITAKGNGTVTVKSRDGFTLTWRVDDQTKIRKRGGKASLPDLVIGDRVAAIGEKTSNGGTARAIVARPA